MMGLFPIIPKAMPGAGYVFPLLPKAYQARIGCQVANVGLLPSHDVRIQNQLSNDV